MKKLLLVFLAFVAIGNAYSQGIVFEQTSLEEVLAKAKNENKVIFVDCYTKWCGPCKYLAKHIFTLEEIGKFFNDNFISIKIDMESKAGKPLMEKYKIKAFPTLLWLDSNGNIQHKIAGVGGAKDLQEQAVIALNDEKNLKSYLSRFEKGERDSKFLYQYMLSAVRASEDIAEASNSYYSNKKEEDLFNKEELDLILNTVGSFSNPRYQLILKNKEKFYQIGDKQEVTSFLERHLQNELFNAWDENDNTVFVNKQKEIRELDSVLGPKVVDFVDLQFLAYAPEQAEKYYKTLIAYAKKYEMENAYDLQTSVYQIASSEKEISEDILSEALKLIKHSINLETNCYSFDTYATLLHKMGKIEEATVQAKRAIDLATEEEKENLWSVKFLNEG